MSATIWMPSPHYHIIIFITSRPVESHSGAARETIIGGPYHNLILYAPRSRRRRKKRKEKTCEGCPLTIRLWVWGSVVSSPSCRKWISCIYEVRKTTSETPFSVFLSAGGPLPPPNVVGPVKTPPPLPPSRRALVYLFRARFDCVKRPCSSLGRLRRYNFVKLHYIILHHQ